VSKSVKITSLNNVPHLTDGKNAVRIPDEFVKPTSFVLSQDFITTSTLEEQLSMTAEQAQDLIEKLANMKIIT
jgi:hypothetical protein